MMNMTEASVVPRPASGTKLTLFAPLRLLLVEGKRPPIRFTPTEYQIISLLFQCPEQVIRDQVLMARIEGITEITESVSPANLLERHVGAIRAKLEQTGVGASVYRVRGKGYVFLWESGEQNLPFHIEIESAG